MAPQIEKLIESAMFDVDELREELGRNELNEEWSKRHWMTKNIARVEDVANGMLEGGEKHDEGTENTVSV